jgi:hypothetical protein
MARLSSTSTPCCNCEASAALCEPAQYFIKATD